MHDPAWARVWSVSRRGVRGAGRALPVPSVLVLVRSRCSRRRRSMRRSRRRSLSWGSVLRVVNLLNPLGPPMAHLNWDFERTGREFAPSSAHHFLRPAQKNDGSARGERLTPSGLSILCVDAHGSEDSASSFASSCAQSAGGGNGTQWYSGQTCAQLGMAPIAGGCVTSENASGVCAVTWYNAGAVRCVSAAKKPARGTCVRAE